MTVMWFFKVVSCYRMIELSEERVVEDSVRIVPREGCASRWGAIWQRLETFLDVILGEGATGV